MIANLQIVPESDKTESGLFAIIVKQNAKYYTLVNGKKEVGMETAIHTDFSNFHLCGNPQPFYSDKLLMLKEEEDDKFRIILDILAGAPSLETNEVDITIHLPKKLNAIDWKTAVQIRRFMLLCLTTDEAFSHIDKLNQKKTRGSLEFQKSTQPEFIIWIKNREELVGALRIEDIEDVDEKISFITALQGEHSPQMETSDFPSILFLSETDIKISTLSEITGMGLAIQNCKTESLEKLKETLPELFNQNYYQKANIY